MADYFSLATVEGEFKAQLANPYEPYDGDEVPVPVHALFWVAINGHASDSRRRPGPRCINSYFGAPVFRTSDALVFEYRGIYRIPEDEYRFIEGGNVVELDMFDLKAMGEEAVAAINNANESTNESKEDTMSNVKSESVNTSNTKKESTMSNDYTIPFKSNGKYDYTADKAAHAEFRKDFKVGRVKGIEIAHGIEGKDLSFIDAEELVLLGKVAKKLGWKGEIVTGTQAGKFHGVPNPEWSGHGWLIQNAPKTSKAGKTSQFSTVVYPMEAWVWETDSGLPEEDAEMKALAAARRAKRAANKAARELKAANKAAGIKPKRNPRNAAKKVEVIEPQPIPAAAAPAPAKLIHIKLSNGVEFDARDAKEAAELKALFE